MIPTNFICISIRMAFTVRQTDSAYAPDSAIAAGHGTAYFARTEGNLEVAGSATISGPAFIGGDLEATNGKMIISNKTIKKEAYLDLRAGTPVEVAIVPTYSFIANNETVDTPTLFISRSNMPDYPVSNAIMMVAAPSATPEFENEISVNGTIVASYQASVDTAGTNSSNRPRFEYIGFPIYIFNAPAANGYYDIVFTAAPISGGVLCVIYDDNQAGTYTQTVRLFTSDGTTLLGEVVTNGSEQSKVLAGVYVSGQPQTLYAIKSNIKLVETIPISTGQADALHAATKEAKGFTFKKQA